MDKETAVKIYMLIFTLLAYIEPHEQTRKSAKLRRNTRKMINKLAKEDRELFDNARTHANKAWDDTKHELNDHNYRVSIEHALRVLYGFVRETEFKEMFFTEKVFEAGVCSMEAIGVNPDYASEEDTNRLVDLFAKNLNVKQESSSKLSLIKKNIEFNRILEGKE